MEAASSLQHRVDSFSRGWLGRGAQPSLERLADGGLGHSFGSSRSFIDMDPAELFSMRWALQPAADFDFGVPGSGPPSPTLVSASQIIRDGRLLPCEPAARSDARERGDDAAAAATVICVAPAPPRSSASSPLYLSAHSTPASLSSCSSTRSLGRNAGRRCGRPPSWKLLLRYLRFLMPLCKKIRALRRFTAATRPRVAPGSPARASTSSMEWCHGSADTAVRDAILYCKKSSGQDI